VLELVDMEVGVPHSFMINADVDGNDIWVATGKGLGWGHGDGYYPGLRPRPRYAYGRPAPGAPPVSDAVAAPPASGARKEGR
jgi:hypothetical protein